MNKQQVKNLAASVRDRLLQISKKRGEDYQFVLTRYANERFLYRLSRSPYRNQFVLKGAMLFLIWTKDQYRPTRDIDLLGFSDNSEEALTNIFQQICRMKVKPDGLSFDTENIRAMAIRKDQKYHGQRILLSAFLGQIHIRMRFDVGVGDIIVPKPSTVEFPVLLDFPPPKIRTYPKETVVSEKLQIMVELGIANSRMKDYYDLYVLANFFDFQGSTLLTAIKSTFKKRQTEITSDQPVALSDDFINSAAKQDQWNAFIKVNNVHHLPDSLDELVSLLSDFLLPPLKACTMLSDKWIYSWKSGGPWIRTGENNKK